LVTVAACAALLALVLNVLARAFFTGGAVVPVAFLIAGLVAMWFAKFPARALTKQERARFLWSYTGFLAFPTLLVLALASIGKGVNLPAVFIAALYLLAYPATAQFFLSEKMFNVFLGKKT
jgi:hypothetical protein